MIRGRRLAVLVILGVLGIAAARDLLRLGEALPWRTMYDFQDFYCAGDALDRGANPYRYEPLHACEHRVNAAPLFRNDPALAIPAPQPAYDFPPFMALAKLDYSTARAIDALAIVLALGLTVLALARAGIPVDVAAIALALPAVLELNAGQIVPFALLFLAAAGAALAARRDALAGIFAALTLVEPHVGVFVALAAFVLVPRARIAVAITAALLVGAGCATVGAGAFFEHIWRVLPAQAAAEVGFPYQYSLTYAARFLGLSAPAALALGNVSVLAGLGAALWIGPRIASSMQRRELLVFFPAACSVFAGPYLHMVELCVALPAALVFATHLRGMLRTLSAAALCTLMVPWIAAWGMKKLFLASVFACALILVRLQIDPAGAVAIASGIAAALYAFELAPPHLPAAFASIRHYAAGDLVQTEWRTFTEQLATRDFSWFAVKVPTWAAVAALLGVALGRLRQDSDDAQHRLGQHRSEP